MFDVIGGKVPVWNDPRVMNLLNLYPQTFLLTVMVTKIEPATGLYESTA